MYENIKLSLGEVTRLELDRPEKKNALNNQLFRELGDALDDIKKTETKVVILSGKGDTFCSGLDRDLLAKLADYDETSFSEMVEFVQGIISDLRKIEAPVIAAVERYAIGGGLQLALVTDVRVATSGTVFSVKEPEFGIVPDMGALHILPRLVGDGIARELVFTRRNMDAEEGKKTGLVNDIYEDIEEGIEKYTEEFLSAPLEPLKESKKLIEESWTMSLEESLEKTKESQITCLKKLKQS